MRNSYLFSQHIFPLWISFYPLCFFVLQNLIRIVFQRCTLFVWTADITGYMFYF
nr:MAG TPA: hypothetical protein [Caudoviricetes sp.]